MKEIDMIDFKLRQDDKFITLNILDAIDINTLKRKICSYLDQSYIDLLDNLISDDGILCRNQSIVIDQETQVLEQYVNNYFAHFYLGSRELLIDKINSSYFYLENGVFYSSKELQINEKEDVNPKIIDLLSYLRSNHENSKYQDAINLLYHDLDLVDDERVKMVIEDDTLELVIPDFYEVSPVWMKMGIVLKKTKEIIGSIEFNFKLDNQDYYDYKGNVSYEIKNDYQGNGYATASLSLVRKYLQDRNANNTLYVSTERNNESSQRVAIKNDGILCYEGKVPKSSVLNFLGKVRNVKIYRIENM